MTDFISFNFPSEFLTLCLTLLADWRNNICYFHPQFMKVKQVSLDFFHEKIIF